MKKVSLVSIGLALALHACSDKGSEHDPPPPPPPDNEAPTVVAGVAAAVEDGGPVSAHVPAATDADGNLDPAGYALATSVAEGSLTLASDGEFVFDPGLGFQELAAGATRDVSFQYTASDTAGAVSSPATVTITVTGVNDAPTLVNALVDQRAATAVAFTYTVSAEAFSDVDDGDTVGLSASGMPDWLTFDGSGTFTGTPATVDLGGREVTVTATDGSGAAITDAFVIQVRSSPGGEDYQYDAAGRLLSVTYGNGAVVSYTYDMAGNVLSRTVTP